MISTPCQPRHNVWSWSQSHLHHWERLSAVWRAYSTVSSVVNDPRISSCSNMLIGIAEWHQLINVNSVWLHVFNVHVLFDLTAAPKPVFCHGVHEGPIITLQRSPFFRDVVLCIGGWTFSIWKEGVTVFTRSCYWSCCSWVQFSHQFIQHSSLQSSVAVKCCANGKVFKWRLKMSLCDINGCCSCLLAQMKPQSQSYFKELWMTCAVTTFRDITNRLQQ